jgi:hypothetical protein
MRGGRLRVGRRWDGKGRRGRGVERRGRSEEGGGRREEGGSVEGRGKRVSGSFVIGFQEISRMRFYQNVFFFFG